MAMSLKRTGSTLLKKFKNTDPSRSAAWPNHVESVDFLAGLISRNTSIDSLASLAKLDTDTENDFDTDLSEVKHLCAVFSHSLQRNGANNFLLFLLERLKADQDFILYSPKKGPMKEDFEEMGITVKILNPNSSTYAEDLQSDLEDFQVKMCLCNTIMRADVVTISSNIGIPSVWVIHESWPPEQFQYYAKEVFMMKHIDEKGMKAAFRLCSHLVFPSNVQREIFRGLYDENIATTIYNGIPVSKMDAYMRRNERTATRASMGYSEDDFVVLHLGTICFRKGQIYTARAFSQLVHDHGVKNAKLLMVGARYIRDHEVKYIGEIKSTLETHGIAWKTTTDGEGQATILDIQSNVYPYYLAADVILVPSLNEVLPLVIGEAMTFRRPVIASNIAAIPEAMDHGKEGLFVTPEDADELCGHILRLYNNPDERREMGEQGRTRVTTQFSYDVMAQNYRNLFDGVLQSV
jgi:glycosyltransferase involved in cell wall biosynthesis